MIDILEGNELIAFFINGKTHDGVTTCHISGHLLPFSPYFKFDHDYNDLMPVVEIISAMNLHWYPDFKNSETPRFEIIANGYVRISNIMDYPIFHSVSKSGSLLNAIYKSVVDFVKWYNEQKINTNDRT